LYIERVNIAIDIGFTMYRLGEDKPCITFVSGISDNDACGIALLKKFVEELKDRTLHGTILVVPQLNELNLRITSCRGSSRSSTFCRIIEKLATVIPRDCVVFVIRCRSNFVEHLVVYRELYDGVKNFVEAIPIEYVVKDSRKGITEIIKDLELNVVTIVLNGGKEFDLNHVENYLNILMKFLSNIGVVKRKATQVTHRYFEGYSVVRCADRGIFIPKIQRGVDVYKGTPIGVIENKEIVSDINGVVLYISNPRLCTLDEVIAVIAIEKKDISTHP
jgi:predicted deacylase